MRQEHDSTADTIGAPEGADSPLGSTAPFASPLPDSCYWFGDVGVAVRCASPALRDEVDRAWAGSRRPGVPRWTIAVLPPAAQPELDAQLRDGRVVHQSFLYPEVPFRALELAGGMGFATLDHHRGVLDFDRRRGFGCAPENPTRERTRSVVNTVLVPMLNEILAREGQYLMHCAALERGGRGVVIAAASGDGKTTSALALMERGWRLLADDMIILDSRAAPPTVCGVARDLRICPPTLALFPRLAGLATRPLDGGKVPLSAEELQGAGGAGPVAPDLVLFPRPDLPPGEDFRVVPATEGIEHLVPHGLFVTGTYGWERRMFALLDLLGSARSVLVRRHLPIDRLADLVEALIHEGAR